MNNNLDSLLKNWSRRSRYREDQLSDLLNRTRLAVAEDRERPQAQRTAHPHAWRYILQGAVLASILLIGVYLLIPTRSVSPLDATGIAEHEKNVFREVDRLFDHNLRWAALVNNELKMGIDEEREGPGAEPEFVVRMIIVSREKDQEQWKMLWKADVLARTEEFINVPLDSDAQRLGLWLYRVNGNQYALDAHLNMQTPFVVDFTAMNVVKVGEPRQMMEFEDLSAEYRIYHVIQTLDECSG